MTGRTIRDMIGADYFIDRGLHAGVAFVAMAGLVLFAGAGCARKTSSASGGQLSQPRACVEKPGPPDDELFKCRLRNADSQNLLPKHLDEASLEDIVMDIRALSDARMALRRSQITETAFAKTADALQSDCTSRSGLSCTNLLLLPSAK